MIDATSLPLGTGARRSLEILQDLGSARLRALGGARASRAISDLWWQRAQSYAIQRDDSRSVWHAGHVTAILTNDVDVVAATQTGGVWLLHRVVGPSPLAGFTGTPVSASWDSPDVSCMAWSPDRTQVYVGMGAGAMFLLTFETALGGQLSLTETATIPTPFARATTVVVLTNPNRVVVGTTAGVWWCPIPQPATNPTGYDWQAAEGLSTDTIGGMAVGPGGTVVAATLGGRPLGIGGPAPSARIYRGTFQGPVLTFTESSITGGPSEPLRRTSLASCEEHPERMYAVSAATDQQLLSVFASEDGGATWRATPTPDKSKAGLQGQYNNCIAVSPHRPDVVVIGWRAGGAFWSTDGAQSWTQPHHQDASPHLHSDLHALCLGRNPGGPEPLYVGGDGGIAVSLDMGQTYHSHFNRPLNNLQFYGGARASVLGTYGGSLTASSRYPGLLAGGLQDNGNVYRCPDTRSKTAASRQADTPWVRQVGGDGDVNRFVDALGVLLNFDNTNTKLGMAIWDEAANRFPSGPGAVIPADGNPAGVAPTAVDVVQKPAFRMNGQLMYACVGSTADGIIHGLFAADPAKDRPDARDVVLTRLAFVGGVVTAIASIDGATLMVGTDSGRIVSVDSASGAVSPYALPDVVGDGVVSRIEVFPPPPLGALPDNAYALVGGRILRFNGLFWSVTSGTDWTTFAYDELSGRIFAATDGDVFVSHDRGQTWVDASAGLPARPHCTDLRIAADGTGGRDLYLATYGHSVWRATIAQRPSVFELPPEAVDALLGVLEDGGGIVRQGKRFIKVPPRPLARDVLAALVIDALAQATSDDADSTAIANARAIQRTALRQLADIALREANRLG
jgi:hypothetical protein